jgi:cytochrome c-type biogenesis protein CcmH
MKWLAVVASLLAWLGSTPVEAAAMEPAVFASPEQQERYRDLLAELRCLVCQNQSLADSDAPLADDLRREVHKQLNAGASDQQVLEFMVARYGDFVLYRPPMKAITWPLWAGPFVLGMVGIALLMVTIRRRRSETTAVLEESERTRMQQLLERDHS